jgi:hypothetical protein
MCPLLHHKHRGAEHTSDAAFLVIENHGERCATAVRENVRPTLAIVLHESPNGHRLHCARENSGRRVIDPGGDTKQNDAVLCAELGALALLLPVRTAARFRIGLMARFRPVVAKLGPGLVDIE